MEQHIGHRTFYQNVRRYVSRDPQLAARWVEVSYWEPGRAWERLPLLPEKLKGTLRGCHQVRRGLASAPCEAVFFNTQVPAVFALDWLRRRPCVVSTDITPIQYDTLADFYGHRPDRPGLLRWLKHRVNRAVFHRAARVVAWSNWVRRSLEADYGVPAERIAVVPPGVDLELWTPSSPSHPLPPRGEQGGMRILFVGGDFARKGGPALLEAYHVLRQQASLPLEREGVELYLVTRERVSHEPGVHVYHGLKPNSPELRRLYRESDVFVLPTRGEAFGIAAVEASASGLPVIATSVGGLPDVVADGETGFLVPPDDPGAVAMALERLLNDPAKRQEMGRAARRRAEAHFDAQTNAAQLVALLQEAVG